MPRRSIRSVCHRVCSDLNEVPGKSMERKDAIALAIPANKQVGEMEEEDLEDEKDYKAVPADFTAIRELFSECSRDCSYWGGDDKVVIFDI